MVGESQLSSRGEIFAAGPIFLALLLAPILFGGTTESTARILDGLCFAGLAGIFAFRLLGRKGVPSFPISLWLPISLLVGIGALHLAFPRYTFVSESWSFDEFKSKAGWFPGTVDRSVSAEAYRHFLALVAAFAGLNLLCRNRDARWWVIRCLAISGLIVAVVGIGQKLIASDRMMWAAPEESGHLFFGAFRYHANASTFLNLTWPASFALWLRSRQGYRRDSSSSFWLVSLVVTVCAVFVNSSKAGHLLCLLLLAIAVIRYRRHLPLGGDMRNGWVVAAVAVGFFFVSATASGASASWEKWKELFVDGSSWTGRITVYEVCLDMLPDAGTWGNGPGTFWLVFPFYTGENGAKISGFWQHAHQDYLQAWIEWGLAGFLLFGFVLIAGLSRGFRFVRRARKARRMEFSASLALLAIGGVSLHALVDFPFQIPAIQLASVAWFGFLWIEQATRRSEHHAYTKDARMQHAGVNRERRDLELV